MTSNILELQANNKVTEQTIKLMGLETYAPYEPQPTNLPEPFKREEVTQAIADSLAAGNDPATDPAVDLALKRYELAQFTLNLQLKYKADEAQRHAAHIKAAGAGLIAEMKTKFEDAAETLRNAYTVLGDEPLWDRNFASPSDKNALTRLQAQVALHTADRITESWARLLFLLGDTSTGNAEPYHYATLAPQDVFELMSRPKYGAQARVFGAWDVLMFGGELDLATSGKEMQERKNKISPEVERLTHARASQLRAEADRLNAEAFAAGN